MHLIFVHCINFLLYVSQQLAPLTKEVLHLAEADVDSKSRGYEHSSKSNKMVLLL